MNYLIINGKKSTEIRGLLIQSLPPIVKAERRVLIEEVDGKDGDSVTHMGYMAYDKTLSIGLHGFYDVDDVIEYFDTEGQIIFSNESDKIYTFTGIAPINFERLIRFRTAEVTLHVQPFKLSAVEKEIVKTVGASGSTEYFNSGNIYSKPTWKFTGTGDVTVYVNDMMAVAIDFGDTARQVIIDVDEYEAVDNEGNFLNRLVSGDYANLSLKKGTNTLSWTGNMSQISVSKYSRWR